MEHVKGTKSTEKKKNKVEEIQLANPASLGSFASKNGTDLTPTVKMNELFLLTVLLSSQFLSKQM